MEIHKLILKFLEDPNYQKSELEDLHSPVLRLTLKQ